RPQSLCTGNCLIVHIQFPQRSNKANGSTRSVELKLVFRWFGKVDIPGSGRNTRPPKAIGGAQWAQFRKTSRRVFAECRLPILGERTGAKRKKRKTRPQNSRPD